MSNSHFKNYETCKENVNCDQYSQQQHLQMQDLAYLKRSNINVSKEVNEIIFNKFRESMCAVKQLREILKKEVNLLKRTK